MLMNELVFNCSIKEESIFSWKWFK